MRLRAEKGADLTRPRLAGRLAGDHRADSSDGSGGAGRFVARPKSRLRNHPGVNTETRTTAPSRPSEVSSCCRDSSQRLSGPAGRQRWERGLRVGAGVLPRGRGASKPLLAAPAAGRQGTSCLCSAPLGPCPGDAADPEHAAGKTKFFAAVAAGFKVLCQYLPRIEAKLNRVRPRNNVAYWILKCTRWPCRGSC